jgi:hypothetical protein
MTRTATRVAAAVGATVVMMGLATPALACVSTEAGGARAVAVSSDPAKSADQAKNDPGKAFHKADHFKSLTLAELQAKLDAKIGDGLVWIDAIKAKVSASDRLSDEQKAAFLAKLQAKQDALTQLRADVAAATTTDEVKAALKAADFGLFGRSGWHHGGRFGDRHHDGRFGDRHHNGGLGGDNNQRHGDNGIRGGNDRRGGHDQRGGNDNHGGGNDNHGGGNDNHGGGNDNHGGGFHH